MLSSLSIKNFALIEKLQINFSKQFSIITGETGAGKSILLGALGLVLGKRADLTSLKDKEQKCIIEAEFEIADYNLQSFFKENDLDYENTTIIRREILPSGKSRAFVNDSPINLSELQALGEFLLDIHSQHQTQELSNENYQTEILDIIAKQTALILEYQTELSSYKKAKTELKKAEAMSDSLYKEKEYNNFLLQELLDAKLISGEQALLELEYGKLSNIEFIKERLSKSSLLINEEELGILQQLKEVKNALHKLIEFSSEYELLYNRITSSLIEIEDISTDIYKESEKLINDPEQLEFLNTKLQNIYTLQKKHQVFTIQELLDIQNQLDSKLLLSSDLEELIKKLTDKITKSERQLNVLANTIHTNRIAVVPSLINHLSMLLSKLGMADAQFDFKITSVPYFLENGNDEVQLLFSANKGSSFGLLKKTASGGEMSRIMLAIKAILANYSKLPTIIFDEIDTGVSGEIAHKMGDIMKQMSSNMQVFAITHLPQIAAKGNQHYKVFKQTQNENTISELHLLTPEERIIEIAEMLSGKDITESALNHAKALLN